MAQGKEMFERFTRDLLRDAFLLSWLGFFCGCSSISDLSKYAPYNEYAGKDVVLIDPMPVELDLETGVPSKVVPSGSIVTIKRVYLEKSNVSGPIIPGFDTSTQIFATADYIDPGSKDPVSWNYPLGFKKTPSGYVEQIIAAPWEPSSTPIFRYVGKDGKGFKN